MRWNQIKTPAIDAAVGLGAGLVGPKAFELAVERIPQVPALVLDNENLFAAGFGALLAIPVWYWRGANAAVITVAAALLYGVGPMLLSWVSGGISAASAAVAPVTQQGPAGRMTANMGLLTASRDMGALRVQMAGQPAAVAQGNAQVFGSHPFGGGSTY